jgi:hypothetical protein
MRMFTVSSGKEELRLVHVEPLDRPRKLATSSPMPSTSSSPASPGPSSRTSPTCAGWARGRTCTSVTGTASARRPWRREHQSLTRRGPAGRLGGLHQLPLGKPALYVQRAGGAPASLVTPARW